MPDLKPPPVRLQLFVGPAVPVPAPKLVLDALQEVKVESGSGGTQSGFELTFSLSKQSPLHTLFLLTGGTSIPILRVVIAVTVGGLDRRPHRRRDDPPRDLHERAGRDPAHQGQGPHRGDGHHPARRPALPRHAAGGARAASPREVRRARLRSAGDPERPRGHPDPDRADPAAPGHRLRLRQGAGRRGRLRLLHRPRPGARRQQGLLGARRSASARRSRR